MPRGSRTALGPPAGVQGRLTVNGVGRVGRGAAAGCGCLVSGCLGCHLASVARLAHKVVDGLGLAPALLGDDVGKVDGTPRLRWQPGAPVGRARTDGTTTARGGARELSPSPERSVALVAPGWSGRRSRSSRRADQSSSHLGCTPPRSWSVARRCSASAVAREHQSERSDGP